MEILSYLKELLENPPENDKYIIDTNNDKKFTYAEFHKNSLKFATNLHIKGLRKGDVICSVVENSIDTLFFYFGCLLSGIIVIPINQNNYKSQLEFIYRDSKARAICSFSEEILETSKINCDLKILLSDLNADLNLSKDFVVPFANVDENNKLLIVYTSGTSANPKGVIHTYKSIFTSAKLFSDKTEYPLKGCIPTLLPMSYLGGYFNLFLIPYINKSSIIVTETFNMKIALKFWEIVDKYSINTLWLVPSIVGMLLKLDRKNPEDKSKKIIKCFVGTDFLGNKLRNQFKTKYNLEILENYGLSETLFISTQNEGDIKEGSVGSSLKGVEIKIADSNFMQVKNEQEGEIFIKSDTLSLGYLNKDFELNDDWLSTGDIGKIKNNNLYITGRKKDIIIRGGINISPAFIEETVLKNNEIESAAAIGLRNEINGDDIVVIVSLRNNYKFNFNLKEFTKRINNQLPSFSRISKAILIDNIPKTNTGKIQRNKLKNWIIKGDFNNKKVNKFFNEVNKDYFKSSNVVEDSQEAISITYNNLVYELKNEGKDIITLSLGEAFFDIPLYSFKTLPFPDIYHYSHSRGILKLRKCLSKYFLDTYGIAFSPESEIVITSGSKIAIHMSLMAILNPGDEAIIIEPAWVSYPEQVKLCHAIPKFIPYYEDIYSIEKYITNRTKLIIINNPNNPSGKVYSLEELNFLLYLSDKYNIYILSDEAYSEFTLNKEDFISLGNLDKNLDRLLIVNSISKNYGISGWRLGYVITNARLINQILKLNQHLVTCPPTILQYYITEYFYKIIDITYPQIKDLLNKRVLLSKFMDDIGLKYLAGNSTFYFFISIEESKLDSHSFCTFLLKEHKVATVPGIGYGKSCDKFLRVSIGSETIDRTKNALYIIKKLINCHE